MVKMSLVLAMLLLSGREATHVEMAPPHLHVEVLHPERKDRKAVR